MPKYGAHDIVDCYFIVYHEQHDPSMKRIVAWSTSKAMVDAYIYFHKCRTMVVKKITGEMDHIYRVMDENACSIRDEINIFNIDTIDRAKHKLKVVQIPSTETEMNFLNEEINEYWSSHIAYGNLHKIMPFLKRKYRDALKGIYLDQFIDKIMSHDGATRYIPENIMVDQLKLLIWSYPNMFGT